MLSSAHLKFFLKKEVKNTGKFSSLVALKGKLGFEALWDFSRIIFLIIPTVHCALIFPPMACAGKNLVARREICANFKVNLQNFDRLWLEYL